MTKTNRTRKRAVGTVKKSIATKSRRMVGKERPPGLRRSGRRFGISRETVRSATWMPSFRSSPWMRGAPQRGLAWPCGNQSPDFGVNGRRTSGRAAREPGPIVAKAAPLPPQDGVRGHDHEGPPPPGPGPGQPDPEKPVHRTKLGPSRRSLVDGELLAQSQVLEGKLAVAPDEEGEEPNQVEYEGNHRARIPPDRCRQIKYLVPGPGFGEAHERDSQQPTL